MKNIERISLHAMRMWNGNVIDITFYAFEVYVPRDGVPLAAIYIGGTNSFYVSFYVSSGMSNVISSLLTTLKLVGTSEYLRR